MTTNTTDERPPSIHVTEDEGGSASVSVEDLEKFKKEIDYLIADNNKEFAERRLDAADIRFCRWEGQSPDGLKHADALNGETPFPFEGARDSRVRSADQICNERMLVLVAAALGAALNVKPMEMADAQFAGRMNTLLRWVLFNQMGSRYLREIMRLCQFFIGDSPGGSILGVWWCKENALRNETLTLESFAERAVEKMQVPPEQLVEFQAMFQAMMDDPELEAPATDLLKTILPNLSAKTARRIIGDLRDEGTSVFPMPYERVNGPELCAYRLFTDIFFPVNTRDPQKARCYFVREWLSEVELKERQVSYGYAPEFVEALMQHEGKTAFTLYEPDYIGDATSRFTTTHTEIGHEGEYEVIRAVYRAVNEDNVPGIYTISFSKFIEEPATDRELLPYLHGEYPFIWFSNEILTGRLIDTRGVPELEQTSQQIEKQGFDSFCDNASLAALPMITVPRRRANLAVTIGPLRIIKEDRPDEVNWKPVPPYPATVEKMLLLLNQRRDEYWGRISAGVPAALTQLHQQGAVNLFLASLKDALKQLLQLCQQYMTDEEVARVTGTDGQPIAKSAEEIQGAFDIDLSFSTIGLNPETLVMIAEVVAKLIAPLDTMSTIQRDKLTFWLLNMLNPNLAENVWRPAEVADGNEMKDESVNFARIAAGDEPLMQADGQNFALRLNVLQSIIQKNPEAAAKLSPKSREILTKRMEHLSNQVEQQQNAVIGARVGQSALGG
jgi:hypothetical protein